MFDFDGVRPRVTTYTYSVDDRLTDSRPPAGGWSAHGPRDVMTYTYGGDGRLVRVTACREGPGAEDPETPGRLTYLIDARGRLTGVVDAAGETTHFDVRD